MKFSHAVVGRDKTVALDPLRTVTRVPCIESNQVGSTALDHWTGNCFHTLLSSLTGEHRSEPLNLRIEGIE